MDFEQLITTHGTHISIAALIIFALTFIDGLVLVGLLINGWLAFSVCMFSYANGYITLPTMMAAAFLGVFSAEQLSFYLAHRAGDLVIEKSVRAVGALEGFKRTRFGRYFPFGVSAERFERSLRVTDL